MPKLSSIHLTFLQVSLFTTPYPLKKLIIIIIMINYYTMLMIYYALANHVWQKMFKNDFVIFLILDI
ncbi:hypothetical protein A9G48_03405 [Gilliamella sp. wkB18]|nr:hypothetical protein GAPWKB11_0088 [Gilliamella apicola]OCG64293.1 hypothetical protein A9G48_03405 [Gilliamella apicola]